MPGLVKGDRVKAVIDWDRRYLFMKYHTWISALRILIVSRSNHMKQRSTG
jgi:misacylated tRNA(Ala) deacylase